MQVTKDVEMAMKIVMKIFLKTWFINTSSLLKFKLSRTYVTLIGIFNAKLENLTVNSSYNNVYLFVNNEYFYTSIFLIYVN